MTREELEKKYLGKRVAVYRVGFFRKCGLVHAVSNELGLNIILDGNENMFDTFHPKQVRLIKKVERRRIWVKFKERIETIAPDGYTKHVSYHDCVYHPDWPVPDGSIEFVEVKKK